MDYPGIGPHRDLLDVKLQNQVERLAQNKGKDIGDIVNHLVRKEVELLDELIYTTEEP